jgi:DNA-directed RNA polymerase specialized sigma24 family protein
MSSHDLPLGLAPETLQRHVDGVRLLARSLIRDDALAQDVAQDAFLTAPRSPPAHAFSLGGWLRGVALNLTHEASRRSSRRRREEARARPERTPSTVDHVERFKVHRALVEAVWRLEPASPDIVVLRFFDAEPPRRNAAENLRSRPMMRNRAGLRKPSTGSVRHFAHWIMKFRSDEQWSR